MTMEGEEAEYESDPEEAKLSLTMRRREASDDEGGDGEEREKALVARTGVGSPGDSDGEGEAEVYDGEVSGVEDEIDEEEEAEEEDMSEKEEFEKESDGGKVGRGGEAAEAAAEAAAEFAGEERRSGGELAGKKENEPFAVPTAGAFYMHDDRFSENGGGRHRHTFGGRKLWESKDNREWVHDRFEEMNLQDERYNKDRRRTGKGQFRGRGRYRGTDRGYVRGNGSRAFDVVYSSNRNYRGVRGRGPRRYDPSTKKKEVPPLQDKQPGKSFDTTSGVSSGRVSSQPSNTQPELAPPRKHVFASSLSSASPPFYPSGSSSHDVTATQKRDAPIGSTKRSLQPSVLNEESLSAPHSTLKMRGKNIVETSGPGKYFVNDTVRSVSGKPLNNMHLPSSGSSITLNTRHSVQLRGQEKGSIIDAQLNYQPPVSINQGNRDNAQMQIPAIQQRPVQITLQSSSRASQQLGQRPISGTHDLSNQTSSANSSEAGEIESSPGANKSKIALAGKGKDSSVHGSGKGSFLYGGAQVISATGPMGIPHGDQNFSATPALLPVMQFRGQHHGGLGVPAVGMALPGYVAQPQLGFGNSEMTWVPVLAGAAGALGASYPYITVDGGYYSRSSGQTSSLGGIKEAGTNKPNNALKSARTPELVGDEFSQKQNKPRRYSEMNFGQ